MWASLGDWVAEHYWVIGGTISAIGAIALTVWRFLNSKKSAPSQMPLTNINNNMVTVNTGSGAAPQASSSPASGVSPKDVIRILFVDDDTTFAVVKILKTAGWRNTRIVKDIKALDDPDVVKTDIFFIDIQGVGLALKFADQGLGLAAALKKKYKDKKVVLYSAEVRGERFHEAFRLVDDQLAKTAEPYEFLTVVEQLSAK